MNMTITCHLRVLLAKANVERAKQGKPTLSLRSLARESGVSLSVLASLHTGRSQRIDYTTIDRLLNYFSCYFSNVSIDDLFAWEKSDRERVSVEMIQGVQT
jgi:transcriptional regulator with XRE-family HTH domain